MKGLVGEWKVGPPIVFLVNEKFVNSKIAVLEIILYPIVNRMKCHTKMQTTLVLLKCL